MNLVLDALERRVARNPAKALFVFLDVNGVVRQQYTYGSFLDRVNTVASHLAKRRALQPGERVILMYEPGLETMVAFFACVRAGLIPVPVAPPTAHGYTASLYQLRQIAQDCGAVATLTSRESEIQLHRRWIDAEQSRIPECLLTDDMIAPDGAPPCRDSTELLFLQYTSGSTSSPKGVRVGHQNVLHNCSIAVDHETPVTVSWLPQHHDMGLLGYHVYIALSGGTTYGFAPASFIQRPVLWLDTITRYRATASSAPNFAFQYCLSSRRIPEAALTAVDLRSLRYLMAAAEPVRPDTYRRFLQRFEPYGLKRESYFVAYGLAENTLAVTNYGRTALSVNKRALASGTVQLTTDASGIGVATHLMSCGRPLDGNLVRIVDPDRHLELPAGRVGEIWIRGKSTCLGYWNNPALSHESFGAQLNEDPAEAGYLRSGDMGFFHDGELYVCGRRRDLIIVRGQNFFPQDIELVVEEASPLVRSRGVVAFEFEDGERLRVGIVAEVSNRRTLPDVRTLAGAIRARLGLEPNLLALVPPRSVPRTSSGKLIRYKVREMWESGRFHVLARLESGRDCGDVGVPGPNCWSSLAALQVRYDLRGDEPYSLLDAGVESLDLVAFLHDIKHYFEEQGALSISQQIDFQFIQRASIADLFRLVANIRQSPNAAIYRLRSDLENARERHRADGHAMMIADRTLPIMPMAGTCDFSPGIRAPLPPSTRAVLLTGGTGFLGPFLLKSLLEQTDAVIRVLIRARSNDEARHRLQTALREATGVCAELATQFDARVIPIAGDIGKVALGLRGEEWDALTHEIDAIYHNAATVNYLFDYASMRGANVVGTQEVLRLACEGRRKVINHVSTTFIFGWATKPVLYEDDANTAMERLDFGYSQTKWMAEQNVLDAGRRGLPVRIFRPSLITPSLSGRGNNIDITVRLIAFMIKHGIRPDSQNQVSFIPADVTANNIVAIANQEGTIGGTFHVTRDAYSNMTDVTDIITARTGRRFHRFPLHTFVPEMIHRCTRDDLLYPLLDFFAASLDNISAMEFKRYDSTCYQRARDASPWGIPDPSMDETVTAMLAFMARKRIV